MKRYVCSVCGFVYDESKGIPGSGIAPGTKWEDVPSDWVCPVCGAGKDAFRAEGADAPKPQAQPVPGDAPKDTPKDTPEEALEALSPMEISAICSNLARSCEKQYKPEEAARFTELADFYKAKAGPAASASYGEILTLAKEDLAGGFPLAKSAAQGDRGAGRALAWTEKATVVMKSLLERYEKEGEAMLEGTGVYVCTICGYIHIGDAPPALCPICKVPDWKFEKVEGR